MSDIHVAVSCASDTTTGVKHGKDVDVTVTLPDGREINGEVTLLPREDGDGYGSWGSPDHWVSGPLLRGLTAYYELGDFGELRDALSEIEAAAAAKCV